MTAQEKRRSSSHSTTVETVSHSPACGWEFRPRNRWPTAGASPSAGPSGAGSHCASCSSSEVSATNWMSRTSGQTRAGGAATWTVASTVGPSA